MAAEERIELDDILGILRRRKAYFVLPFLLIMAAAAYVALTLPAVYGSTATILIERQEIPTDLVETTVTGYVDERIETISTRVMTDEQLWAIAETYDLYPEARSTDDIAATASKIRSKILRETASVGFTSRTGRSGTATVSFSISFEASTPEKAQGVTNSLAELFLLESRKDRIEQAEAVAGFLGQEADRLREEITVLEDKLAVFKQEHASKLPEVNSLNMKMLEKAEVELESTLRNIQGLEQRRIQLKAELAGTAREKTTYGLRKGALLSSTERLSILRSEYLSGSATYGSGHPDMVRLRREISALEGQTGQQTESSRLIAAIEASREQLGVYLQRYSEEYPDVKKLRRRLSDLEKQLNKEVQSSASSASRSTASVATNPRYLSLKGQLDSVLIELSSERSKPSSLRVKIAELENRLMQSPLVEKEYLILNRDYDGALKKYNVMKNKQSEALLAQQLESSSKGERFSLSQPAPLPTVPLKPNRPAIMIIGFVLALGTGIGLSSVAEYYDRRIHGVKAVRAIMGAPPLASIPMIGGESRNMQNAGSSGFSFSKAAMILLLLLAMAGAGAHFLWKPLDQLWFDLTGQELVIQWEDILKSINSSIGSDLGQTSR